MARLEPDLESRSWSAIRRATEAHRNAMRVEARCSVLEARIREVQALFAEEGADVGAGLRWLISKNKEK